MELLERVDQIRLVLEHRPQAIVSELFHSGGAVSIVNP